MAGELFEFVVNDPQAVRVKVDAAGRLIVLEYDLYASSTGEVRTLRFLVSPDTALCILQQLGDLQELLEKLSAQTTKPAVLQ